MASEPTSTRILLGKNIRALRQARELSQEELAARAHIDRTYVSSVERGRRNVAIDNIHRIAAALAVEPSDVVVAI